MKYRISTLGCKVNQYETQAMETILRDCGHVPAGPEETADVVIVNTCAVTAESGRKSRQLIRRLREENPGAVIGVCGCYAQLSPEEVRQSGGTVIFGTGDHVGFLQALEKAAEEAVISVDDPFHRYVYEELPAGAVSGRTRALLKIQDGCVNFCSYCIIPYTRGRLRSLPAEKAAEAAERLAAEGYRELVLTGIEIASWGADLPGRPHLAEVISAIAARSGSMRIRLGSLEPTVVTEEFCAALSSAGGLCRHFHLSLQSGCDRTLKAMNRKYDTARFLQATQLLRKAFPGCGIACDLITGFPGETEEDFRETLAFLKKCAFSDMHIFPYSRRPGTPADKMPGQCTNAVRQRRAAEALAVRNELHRSFLERCVGQNLPVLFETEKDGICSGHSDTYVLVSAPGHALRNRVCNVCITDTDGETLSGVIEEE